MGEEHLVDVGALSVVPVYLVYKYGDVGTGSFHWSLEANSAEGREGSWAVEESFRM